MKIKLGIKMDALEWQSRSAYALTEFVVFAIGGIILALMLVSLGLLFCYFRNSDKHLNGVKALHRSLIRAVFSSADDLVQILYPSVKKEPKIPKAQSTLGKIAVYIYFTLLSGLVALWYLAVFSDSLFYRKTGTCNDLSVNDSDYSCFLISDRNVPPEVQRIIDEEAGELVPCQRVRDFLSTSNVTYNLEVICYLSQLSPLSAMGIAYGAAKMIIIFLQVIFKGCLFLGGRGRNLKRCLVIMQGVFVTSVVLFVVIVPTTLHEVSGPRNTPLDFLRGERFYPYAVVTLLGLSTVLVAGMTPWWAFEPISWKELLCCGSSTSSEPESEDSTNEFYRKFEKGTEKEPSAVVE